MNETHESRSDRSPQVLSPQLQTRLDRHFLACSATVGASIALVAGGAHEAKAQIVYSGMQNVLIPSNDITGIYFDFDTNTFSPMAMSGSDANLFDAYVVPDINGSTAYHSVSFYGPMHPGVTLNSALATLNTTSGETLKLSAGVVIGPKPGAGVFG